ncbi:MAG: glutaredoxin 3 [Rhodospirillales bacterium]
MPDIDIYTTPFCPYCSHAKKLLSNKGVEFTEIDLMRDPGRRQEMLDRANGGYTVPQIFIDQQHIGGCDELYALDQQGGLDPLLQPGLET